MKNLSFFIMRNREKIDSFTGKISTGSTRAIKSIKWLFSLDSPSFRVSENVFICHERLCKNYFKTSLLSGKIWLVLGAKNDEKINFSQFSDAKNWYFEVRFGIYAKNWPNLKKKVSWSTEKKVSKIKIFIFFLDFPWCQTILVNFFRRAWKLHLGTKTSQGFDR